MTKDDLRAALREYRLNEGLTYDELYARCRRRRVSRSALHRFMNGRPIRATGAHALHRFWLSVLDTKVGTVGDQPTAP